MEKKSDIYLIPIELFISAEDQEDAEYQATELLEKGHLYAGIRYSITGDTKLWLKKEDQK